MATLFSTLSSTVSIAPISVDVFLIFCIIIAIIAIVGLFVLLIFKAGFIVSLLRLDKGFDDERIVFGNLKSLDIVKVGIFVIGGLLFMNYLLALISHTFLAFKGEVIVLIYHPSDKFDWAVSAVNLVIGFLLRTNYEFVAKKLRIEKSE